MTESSADKTKRLLTNVLRSTLWSHQYSIFFADSSKSITLLEYIPKFKKAVARSFPEVGMIVCIRTLKKGAAPIQAYLTIYSTEKIDKDNLRQVACKTIQHEVNVMGRAVKPEKLESTIRQILKQSPHNLKAFFNSSKVNRYAMLNKSRLSSTSSQNG